MGFDIIEINLVIYNLVLCSMYFLRILRESVKNTKRDRGYTQCTDRHIHTNLQTPLVQTIPLALCIELLKGAGGSHGQNFSKNSAPN